MKLPTILQAPHPLLRTKCTEVTDFPMAAVIADKLRMAATSPLHVAKAIGLAANQIGITKRVIIVLQGGQWLTLVNPRIVRSEGEQTLRDGCMSVGYGAVFKVRTRPAFIQVEYQDENGVPQRRKAKGINAACIAHEIDHLDGILFTDEPAVAA